MDTRNPLMASFATTFKVTYGVLMAEAFNSGTKIFGLVISDVVWGGTVSSTQDSTI